MKLAKNRQSARDSRKRRKIDVELFEIKVTELSKQIQVLQKNLDQQNIFITDCVNILKCNNKINFLMLPQKNNKVHLINLIMPSLQVNYLQIQISDFNLSSKNLFQTLSKYITKKYLQILEEQFWVNSEKRDCLCKLIFNTWFIMSYHLI
ncbi:unnamed protein product (macronuclear) [Paramecium tetraurelia]|uniref:BZIP domain-containing protein n=1 Tax=Paramecium tetraurelia TaxID=5888 RepID=A0DG96_PARTE|nr:uncharacterized protein GSPATT00002192001 [Paramecium tetraurelia]CAK82063.1 unnamed protein product [Paramecium tetraurelia]|eukprot:XP_001449460.1 hypothetical protein (macronuclear) [Paramecium tetraurelia strain d4-2]